MVLHCNTWQNILKGLWNKNKTAPKITYGPSDQLGGLVPNQPPIDKDTYRYCKQRHTKKETVSSDKRKKQQKSKFSPCLSVRMVYERKNTSNS